MRFAGSDRFERWVMAGMLAASLAALGNVAIAQKYPNRPVRIIIGGAPGGAGDVLARLMSQSLSDAFGQTFVMDNRVGANGVIAATLLKSAPPDGHTLMMGYAGVITVNPHMHTSLPYHTLRDFAPVAMVAKTPLLMVVHPSVPARSVAEFVALAKTKPGAITVAASARGSMQQVSAELFSQLSKASILIVPYKASALAYPDLIGGRASAMFEIGVAIAPLVKAGQVRPLATTNAKRLSSMPDLPTVAESGVPGYEAVGWYGYIAPTGIPTQVVQLLNAEVNRQLALPEMRDRLISLGGEPERWTPQQFKEFIAGEFAKWGKVLKPGGMQK